MTENITSKLTRRQDLSWTVDIKGFRGILQAEFPAGAQKDWVVVKRIFDDGSLLHEAICQGERFTMVMDYPSSVNLRIICPMRPLCLMLIGDKLTEVEEALTEVQQTLTDQQATLDAQVQLNAEQQTTIDMQVQLNAEHQEQIERNRLDNIEQSKQIEQNRLDNVSQQEQIDKNLADDAAQQEQIDANTALNEAQERGIGEEAAQKLVDDIFK